MKKLNLFFLLLFPLFLFSCEKDKDDNDDPTNENLVIITDDITETTIWDGEKVYLIKAYDFYVSATLTIEPGCIVKFHPSDGPYLMLGSNGTINARGTDIKPIVFTSYKDDEHGGDTNGDDDATAPAAKDWGEINTNSENGSVFEYCEFYYGGASTYSSTLTIQSGSVATVSNCVFAHNSGDFSKGWYGALNFSDADKLSSLSDCEFRDNVRPLSIMSEMDVPANLDFLNNTYNAIIVEAINENSRALVKWDEADVPYVIDDNDWWINEGSVLQLASNVVIKFRSDSELKLSDGASSIVQGPSVYFTSFKDDNYGGDTNADGDASSPTSGDWGGIWDNNTFAYLNDANILYAGN